MSATALPPYPSRPSQGRTAEAGVFGELWSRAFALTMVGGGVMGTPLMLCWCWSKGSTPSLGGALGVSFAGLVIGAFAGLFIGIPVAIVGVLVIRRVPPPWQVQRFAHLAGVVVSVGAALLVQEGVHLRPVPFMVYVVMAALVGYWLAPRLVGWYIARWERVGR